MVLFAFSLSDQVEEYGAYVGIACFFGLAVLSLLYFAQAREVKRLRDWAGRAPELGSELEQAVRAFEDRLRRAPVARPQPQQVAVPEPVAANGAVKLKPAEVAALAFARSAGVREPHEPKHHPPVRVAAAAVAAAPAPVATVQPPPAPAPAPVPAAAPTNGGAGGAVPPPPVPVPAPATPAARGFEPLPPRRTAPAARRPAPPPRRESNTRAVVLTAVIGVLVLAGAAFGATQLLGGEDDPPRENTVQPATGDDEPVATATAAPAVTKEEALVAVYNGTGQDGLAANVRQMLLDEGYPEANLGVDDVPLELRRDTSVVMYKRGSRSVADGVATSLDIRAVEAFDDPTKTLIANSGKDWNVVVIVGADKGP